MKKNCTRKARSQLGGERADFASEKNQKKTRHRIQIFFEIFSKKKKIKKKFVHIGGGER